MRGGTKDFAGVGSLTFYMGLEMFQKRGLDKKEEKNREGECYDFQRNNVDAPNFKHGKGERLFSIPSII